tara:strand:+ start:17520 stop:17864 length:345 start_codon:yes stop_codon:yes gene_type:complete
MKKQKQEEVIKMEINPVVTLVVVNDYGAVVLMESLGGSELASVLKLAESRGSEYPLEKSDNLLDCVGQEVYVCDSLAYIRSISGCFFHVSSERSEELLKICEKEGLAFSFVVSY